MAYSLLTASIVNNSTTFKDMGDLRFPVDANKNYHFQFFVRNWCDVTGTGARYAISGTAPATILVGGNVANSTALFTSSVATAFDSPVDFNVAGQLLTTPIPAYIRGIYKNGSSPGTMSLRFAVDATPGAVTGSINSFGIMDEMTGSNFVIAPANQVVSGTVFATSSLSFPVEANTNYLGVWVLFYRTNASTTAARFGISATLAPVQFSAGAQVNSARTGSDSGITELYNTAIVNSLTGPNQSDAWGVVESVLMNGSNSGTFSLVLTTNAASPNSVNLLSNSFAYIETFV